MKKLLSILVAALFAASAFGAATAPQYIQELRVGGGVAAGGADLDASGNISAAGTITGNAFVGQTTTVTIGASNDTDLLSLAANALTVNGGITATGSITCGNGYSFSSGGNISISAVGSVALSNYATGPSVCTVDYKGKNDGNTVTRIGALFTSWDASTAGAETGKLSWALMVSGSTAYSKMVLASTGLTLANNLTVTGGTISTSASTAYLFNSGPTTLYVGGAATTLTMGNASGTTTINGQILLPKTASPASGGTGTAGMIAWDASYIYVCTATNTWKRVAITGGY